MHIAYLTEYPHYIPTLAAWHQAEWGHLNANSTAEARAERLQQQIGRTGIPTTLIAVEDDTLLGSASLVENDLNTHPQLMPFLASVYVAPAYRRRGIASALVRRIVDEARQLKLPRIYLITPNQQRLYANLGWTVLEQVHYRGELVTLMTVTCATSANSL
ncbi:GNAT family N-acetyltransferase [soil metagenome]